MEIKYNRLGGGNQIQYVLDLKALLIKDIEWYSHSDPFLVVSRPSEAHITETDPAKVPATEWVEIARTEFVVDNLNPNFKPFTIDGK